MQLFIYPFVAPKKHKQLSIFILENLIKALTRQSRLKESQSNKVLENFEKSWKEYKRWERPIQELDKEYIDTQGLFKWLNAGI